MTLEQSYDEKSACWGEPMLGKAHARERSHLVGGTHAGERLHLGLPAEYNKNTHTEHRQGFFLAPNVCAKRSVKAQSKRKAHLQTPQRDSGTKTCDCNKKSRTYRGKTTCGEQKV